MRLTGNVWKAALFVVVCTGLLAAFFIGVAGERLLRSYVTYEVFFHDKSVSGISAGSSVEYRGVPVGRVSSVRIHPENVEIVLVEVEIEADVPIKQDVRASLAPQGISGAASLQLSGGSVEADRLPPGGRIQTEPGVVDRLVGSADNVATGLETVLRDLDDLLSEENRTQLAGVIANLNAILGENRKTVDAILSNVEAGTEAFAGTMETMDQTVARANRALDQVYRAAGSAETALQQLETDVQAADIPGTVGEFRSAAQRIEEVAVRADGAVAGVDGIVEDNRVALRNSTRALQRAVNSLGDLAIQLNDDPSLLLGGRGTGGSMR